MVKAHIILSSIIVVLNWMMRVKIAGSWEQTSQMLTPDNHVDGSDKYQIREAMAVGEWWKPRFSDYLTWQWQLQGTIKTKYDVAMYDVDLFTTPQSVIDELHADGRIVVCYFSAGSYEYWRSDWARFFPFVQDGVPYQGSEPPFAGKMDGWDERWLDIRDIALLTPIMRSRMALAASKGCDAVEPDNVEAYNHDDETGIDINEDHQLAYNRFIAAEAHAVGLSVGLKNDLDQLEALVGDFDWALNEQCFQYHECDRYQVFIDQDKAVFGAEYHGFLCSFCAKARRLDLSASWIKKRRKLFAWRRGCEDRLSRALCWWIYLWA